MASFSSTKPVITVLKDKKDVELGLNLFRLPIFYKIILLLYSHRYLKHLLRPVGFMLKKRESWEDEKRQRNVKSNKDKFHFVRKTRF